MSTSNCVSAAESNSPFAKLLHPFSKAVATSCARRNSRSGTGVPWSNRIRTALGQDFARVFSANSRTPWACSRVTPGNHARNSSIVAPDSRFSKRAFTGMRVLRKTHAPLTLSSERSTAGHAFQSSTLHLSGFTRLRQRLRLARAPQNSLNPNSLSGWSSAATHPRSTPTARKRSTSKSRCSSTTSSPRSFA